MKSEVPRVISNNISNSLNQLQFVSIFDIIYRGYYMATRRYEISLQVFKNISWVSPANEWSIFSTQEEKFRISKQPCNIPFII